MKNKKKLGFLTAALATAFVAGCSDEVTNADRSFSDDRDYYVPFVEGGSGSVFAPDTVFESGEQVLNGKSYLNCSALNVNAVYVVGSLGGSSATENLTTITNPQNFSSFCVAHLSSNSVVGPNGSIYHFYSNDGEDVNSNSHDVAIGRMNQDTLIGEAGQWSYPSEDEALENDEFVHQTTNGVGSENVQHALLGIDLLVNTQIIFHPTNASVFVYGSKSQGFYSSSGEPLGLRTGSTVVAIMRDGSLIAVPETDNSELDRGLELYSSNGEFERKINPRSTATIQPIYFDQYARAKHFDGGIWLATRQGNYNAVERWSLDDELILRYQGRIADEPTLDNGATWSAHQVFDGAGNLWSISSGALVKRPIVADGEAVVLSAPVSDGTSWMMQADPMSYLFGGSTLLTAP